MSLPRREDGTIDIRQLMGTAKYRLSLTKILGVGIKDIEGMLSSEYGGYAFTPCLIVLEDGREIGVEGEHDFPYLTEYRSHPIEAFDEDVMAEIDKAHNDQYDELD